MYKILSLLIMSAFTLPAFSQEPKKVTILFTNDLHSRLTGYAPESAYSPLTAGDDNTIGGFARIASIFNAERAGSGNVVFTADAGDFLMGTLFQSLETATGFQLQLMKKMGYDVVAIGNHEFDYGPDKLAEILASASAGEIPQVLLSNAVFSRKDTADDRLAALFADNVVAGKFIIDRGGIRAGFFSLLGKVADENAAFAPPVGFADQVATARKMVRELKSENCDIIICLSHSGVSQEPSGEWGGEDTELARKVEGIDVIISGHTHTRLDRPVIVNGVPVVQTGEYGRFVGKLSATLCDGELNISDYRLIPVDDNVAGDRTINDIIEKQKQLISSRILMPLNLDYGSPLAESGFLLECNEQGDFRGSNLGPFVADAIHSYVNSHVEGGTDISMVATGVIRDKIVPGLQTAPDIFRVMSMGSGQDNMPGYPLARVFVTGKELRSILEILQIAYRSAPANYCYYSGIKVWYDPSKGFLKKISRISIVNPDGQPREVDFSKKNKTLYSITANSYMLEFIGIIKKMSFGLINVVPKDGEGNHVNDMKAAIPDFDRSTDGLQEGKEWLAIMEYIRSMKDLNGNGIPDIDPKYELPVATFFEKKAEQPEH